MSKKRCHTVEDCTTGKEYCDNAVNQCLSCTLLCNPARSLYECNTDCPGYHNKNWGSTNTDNPNEKRHTEPNSPTLPYANLDNRYLEANIVVPVVLGVLILVIISVILLLIVVVVRASKKTNIFQTVEYSKNGHNRGTINDSTMTDCCNTDIAVYEQKPFLRNDAGTEESGTQTDESGYQSYKQGNMYFISVQSCDSSNQYPNTTVISQVNEVRQSQILVVHKHDKSLCSAPNSETKTEPIVLKCESNNGKLSDIGDLKLAIPEDGNLGHSGDNCTERIPDTDATRFEIDTMYATHQKCENIENYSNEKSGNVVKYETKLNKSKDGEIMDATPLLTGIVVGKWDGSNANEDIMQVIDIRKYSSADLSGMTETQLKECSVNSNTALKTRNTYTPIPTEESNHSEPSIKVVIPHPNRRIYDLLKGVDWIRGYYSEGHSIEIYADFDFITPEIALKEITTRTGEGPEKFHIKQADPVSGFQN